MTVADAYEIDEVVDMKPIRLIAHDGQLTEFVYYGSVFVDGKTPHGVGVAFSETNK